MRACGRADDPRSGADTADSGIPAPGSRRGDQPARDDHHVHRYGVEETLSRLDSIHAQRSLVEQWLGIGNLQESAAFLDAHREELLTEEPLSDLTDRDDTKAEVLPAVVLLVDGAEDPANAVGSVYECMRDVAKARQKALTAIERGDLMRLGLLTAANRALRQIALVDAVMQLAEDGEEAAVAALAPLLAEDAATTPEAAIIRLRFLARSDPTMTSRRTGLGVDHLTELSPQGRYLSLISKGPDTSTHWFGALPPRDETYGRAKSLPRQAQELPTTASRLCTPRQRKCRPGKSPPGTLATLPARRCGRMTPRLRLTGSRPKSLSHPQIS